MPVSAKSVRGPLWAGLALVVVGILGLASSWLLRPERTSLEEADRLRRSVEDLVRLQYPIAASVTNDPSLLRWSLSTDRDSLLFAFEKLEEMRGDEPYSLELLDARGELLAWSGRSWPQGRTRQHMESADSLATVFRSGPFMVLSSVASFSDGRAYARVTQALSSENRIISDLIASAWQFRAFSGVPVQYHVILPGEVVQKGHATLDVKGLHGDIVCLISYPVDGSGETGTPSGTAIWFLMIGLGLLVGLFRLVKGYSPASVLGAIGGLWIVRYLFVLLGVSNDPSLSWFGDPSVYASSFGGGLAGSPFDILLSSACLLLTVVWLDRLGKTSGFLTLPGRSSVAAALFLLLGAFLLLILTRGYAASIRSIVVDTTLHMYDRSALLPPPELIPLLASSLLLTISLVIVWRFMLIAFEGAAQRLGFESALYAWGLVIVVVLLATGIYSIVDSSNVLPPFMTFIGLLTGIPLVLTSRAYEPRDARNRIIWIIALIAFAIPTIDRHVHANEREIIRGRMSERMLTGDAWLTFLMKSDLESIAVRSETIRLLSGIESSDPEGTAFNLWSGSVMSRQTANSGLVMFDADGVEVDRFVIGFSTYEQDAILRAVFDGAEEQIYVVQGRDIGRAVPAYGAWSTVRDKDNYAYGTIAIILSPSDEQPLYWAVGGSSSQDHGIFHQAEIQDSIVIRSDVPEMRKGGHFDTRIRQMLRLSGHSWLWVDHPNTDGDLLYMTDPTHQDRIVATFVPDLDIRWHMFHMAKIILVYVLLLLIGSFGRYLKEWWEGRRTAFSIRSKMFAVFIVVSTAPLVLLAIYNDQLSDERTEREVLRSLEQTGGVLVDRMQELFQTDLDVEKGISNDFCASLASDQGVEFSLYTGAQLAASSRPEVFESGILGRRLDAEVFTRMVIGDEDIVMRRQRIGSVSYAVGYFTWRVNEQKAGILSVPTLFRQGEIEADRAERNAYVVVAYGFALLLVMLLGWFFSDRVTRPLRRLTEATGALGRGERVAPLVSGRNDEIGGLLNAFNDMVRELEENKKLLAKVEREQAWREMAKQVAHEIKNPLTPMKLSVQQLLQSFKDKARNREETLWDVSTTLLEQIDALSRIASEFSHFARLPQRAFEKVDVYRSVREASGLFASVPGVAFTLDMPDAHPYVIADSDELRRVFVNLFRNSIQAMEGEGSIHVTGKVMDTHLEIRVEDTGPGVPESLAEKIFEPNFSTKTEGMGLGLAISKKVLEDLGGTIRVTRLDSGACFTLLFLLQ